jgi:hypothetical protein
MPRFENFEERRDFLASIAEVHDAWAIQTSESAPFDPTGRPDPSDYNLHYADVESEPNQEAQIEAAWAAAGLTTQIVFSDEAALAELAADIESG